ncbi:hypothetical protein L379_03892 [Enterobacter sp. MGH 33]|nr:hypothetical protein L379_03892 [Enterobacter sp. MGH 33]KJN33212.1 hypothetical protein SS14_14865 [Enterobacter bugandensis]
MENQRSDLSRILVQRIRHGCKVVFMTNSLYPALHNGLAKLIILTMKVNNILWLTATPILYLSFKIVFDVINVMF